MKSVLIACSMALLLGVAACSDQKSEENASQPASETPAAPQSETTATSDKPAAQQAAATDTETVTNNACVAAVAQQANGADVTVLSNEFSEANTLVMLGVGPDRAPWRCLVSNDGQVQEAYFDGDDSAAAPDTTGGATGGSDVSGAAIDACIAAVTNETGEGSVSVMSTEFSEANSLVMIGVGQNQAPWRCLVSNDAQVQEVMFTGDDSAGVPDTPADTGGSDVSAAAVDACLAAVSGETGNGDVAVTSTEFSEANSLVMVGVGPDRAPWRCLVSNDGQVQEVMSQTDEGAL